MRTFRETHTWAMALGLTMTFALAGGICARERGIRFLVSPAVHEYLETDRTQELANAFMFEGKFDEYRKCEIQRRDNTRKMGKAQKSRQPNPYTKHNYVVIIKPSFVPDYHGFAVEEDKLVYMTTSYKSKGTDAGYAVEASSIDISEEVAEAMRSLIDNITLSARITDDIDLCFDGSTYNIIRGQFPTHMVESSGGSRNDDEGAVCRLFEKFCEAGKSKDAATINAQLKEIKRLSAVYGALK